MHFQFWETFLNCPKCPTIGEESISLGNCFSIASAIQVCHWSLAFVPIQQITKVCFSGYIFVFLNQSDTEYLFSINLITERMYNKG